MLNNMYVDRVTKRLLALSTILYFLAGILQLTDRRAGALPMRFSALSFLIFCSLCILFLLFTQNDFPYPRQRMYYMLAVSLLLAWEMLYEVNWVLFPADTTMSRFLWYCYYIPNTFIPNTLLFAILHTGAYYDRPVPRPWWLTFAVSGTLSVLVLCNDLHFQAFRFPGEVHSPFGPYSYGPLYFVIMGWTFFLFFLCILRVLRVAYVRKIRKKVWTTIIPVGLAGLYFTWWMTGQRVLPWLDEVFSLPEVWGAILLFSLESAIQRGLIRTNFNSRQMFESLTIPIWLEENGEVRYQTAAPVQVDEEKKAKARSGPYAVLDEDRRLYARAVDGGTAYWVENLAPVNQILRQLKKTQEELRQENELITAENTMIARQARAEQQGHLYTKMAQEVQPQTEALEALLQQADADRPDFPDILRQCCLYETYIKRRCNLTLLAQEQERLSLFDLTASIKESLEALRLMGGCEASLLAESQDFFAADALIRLYELFQDVLERAGSSLQQIAIHIQPWEQGVQMTLRLQGPAASCLVEPLPRQAALEKEGGTLEASETAQGLEIALHYPGERGVA